MPETIIADRAWGDSNWTQAYLIALILIGASDWTQLIFFRRDYLIALILIGPKLGDIPSLDQRKTIRILTESLLDKIHDKEGDGQTVH